MESERRINWLSLFIKIVIVFIFALIIIWLISKLLGRNKLSETFTNNINNMEKVSVEYFKTVDLPLDKGKSIKITLGELIEKELIVSVGSDSDNSCDTEDSYSKITREKDKYVVSTTLKCGKEKDTIKTNFSLKDCKNCNQETSNDNNKEENSNNANNGGTTNSNTSGNSNNGSTNSSEGITYYEHVKETTSYTKWMRGNLTGDNIENRYEYYGVAYDTYYTLGVIPANKDYVTYTLKLNNVPNSKYYFTTIEETETFTKDEENNYLNEEDVLVSKGTKINAPKSDLSKYSLEESNFTYKLSPYYREGSFYVRVTVNVKNTNGVDKYYDTKTKQNVYLVPLKISIKFASNEISETKPIGEYETISYYRYVTVDKETIWSKESYVEGYTKTGKTELR